MGANKQLVKLIQKKFDTLISTKNNWGKNQIKQLHDQAVAEACLELIDTDSKWQTIK